MIGLAFLFFAGQLVAAVPVEDRGRPSSSSTSRPQLQPTPVVEPPIAGEYESSTQQQPLPAAAPPSGLAQLFSELQTLRSEVQALRSTVEEQAHQIRKLEAAQQEQYRNLDGRVAQISQGPGPGNQAGVAVSPGSVSTPVAGAGTGLTRAPAGVGTSGVVGPGAQGGAGGAVGTGGAVGPGMAGAPGGVVGPAGEKAAYAAAFDSMKTRQFDKSIQQFNQLIQDYPNGEMTPGSYYWLGELYLAKADMDQSRQSFAQVIDLYPTHNKAPDALYKLGVVYHRQGDNQKALEFLDRVQREFPTSAAAGLARTYASELR